MAMSSLSHDPLLGAILHLLLLLPVSYCNTLPLSSPQGMLMEEKIRLGSTPPSCHNRCNACNPCTAVQVPTLPISSSTAASTTTVRPADEQLPYKKYSNYKPLGWKCRCGDHLFNP